MPAVSVGRLRRLLRLRRVASVEQSLPDSATSVAIIMDGNGRWARQRGLPPIAGHRAGTRALRRTVEAAPGLGVRSLAVYAFSTENWGRPAQEVDDLMELFTETIRDQFPDLHRQGVCVRFVGRRDRCPASLLELMTDMERRTAENTRLDLWVAFDYGGRDELVRAARALVEEGVPADGDRRGRPPCTSVRSRDARPRPRDPHQRRAARVQLPALAGRLRGVPLHARSLARLRRGAAGGSAVAYATRRRRFGKR